MQEINKL